MERICSQCSALPDPTANAARCSACGGEIVERPALENDAPLPGPQEEWDHRGIRLPRRHALGGVITPQ